MAVWHGSCFAGVILAPPLPQVDEHQIDEPQLCLCFAHQWWRECGEERRNDNFEGPARPWLAASVTTVRLPFQAPIAAHISFQAI
jgi:hypothetical protein